MKKRVKKTQKVKRLLDKMEKAERYPHCAGSFDDCPVKEIPDPRNPPVLCRKCPVYTESRYYKAPKVQLDEFAKQVFSKD